MTTVQLRQVSGSILDDEALAERLLEKRHRLDHDDEQDARAALGSNLERVAPRASRVEVLEDDVARGHVWTVSRHDELELVDPGVVDPDLRPAVVRAMERLAAEQGFRALFVGGYAGDDVVARLAGDGYVLASTQMRLELDDDLPAETRVELVPMDEAVFATWRAEEEQGYAEERAAAGESPEVAAQESREQMAELLPQGLSTPDHHFFEGRVDGERIGTLWLSSERSTAFVYDVVVDEAHRRRGYGGGLMRAGALWARDRGHRALGLNVFGHNHGARALYEKLGYVVLAEQVRKVVS